MKKPLPQKGGVSTLLIDLTPAITVAPSAGRCRKEFSPGFKEYIVQAANAANRLAVKKKVYACNNRVEHVHEVTGDYRFVSDRVISGIGLGLAALLDYVRSLFMPAARNVLPEYKKAGNGHR